MSKKDMQNRDPTVFKSDVNTNNLCGIKSDNWYAWNNEGNLNRNMEIKNSNFIRQYSLFGVSQSEKNGISPFHDFVSKIVDDEPSLHAKGQIKESKSGVDVINNGFTPPSTWSSGMESFQSPNIGLTNKAEGFEPLKENLSSFNSYDQGYQTSSWDESFFSELNIMQSPSMKLSPNLSMMDKIDQVSLKTCGSRTRDSGIGGDISLDDGFQSPFSYNRLHGTPRSQTDQGSGSYQHDFVSCSSIESPDYIPLLDQLSLKSNDSPDLFGLSSLADDSDTHLANHKVSAGQPMGFQQFPERSTPFATPSSSSHYTSPKDILTAYSSNSRLNLNNVFHQTDVQVKQVSSPFGNTGQSLQLIGQPLSNPFLSNPGTPGSDFISLDNTINTSGRMSGKSPTLPKPRIFRPITPSYSAGTRDVQAHSHSKIHEMSTPDRPPYYVFDPTKVKSPQSTMSRQPIEASFVSTQPSFDMCRSTIFPFNQEVPKPTDCSLHHSDIMPPNVPLPPPAPQHVSMFKIPATMPTQFVNISSNPFTAQERFTPIAPFVPPELMYEPFNVRLQSINFIPGFRNARKALGPSNELHSKLEECYEQYKCIENERKKTEAELARQNPTKKITSNNSAVAPRLPTNPSRVDRLIVDSFREHSRIMTLIERMEGLLNNSLHPNIHSALEKWAEAIRKVQARRREEIVAVTNRYRSGSNRFHEEKDITALAVSIGELAVATRKARTATWCGMQISWREAPSRKTPAVEQSSKAATITAPVSEATSN